MIVQIELDSVDDLDWLEEAAKEAAIKFDRQFKGKQGTGMSRNRAGRYADFMRKVAVAANIARHSYGN